MYILNHNPPANSVCKIVREPFGKFWQLIGDEGIIAESDSQFRLKDFAKRHKLKISTS